MLSDREYELMEYLAQHGHTDRSALEQMYESDAETVELIKNLISLQFIASEPHEPKMLLTPSGWSELKRHQNDVSRERYRNRAEKIRFVISTILAATAIIISIISLCLAVS